MVEVEVEVEVEVVMNLEQEEQEVRSLASRLAVAKASLSREKKELEKAQAAFKHCQDAQEILQHLAQAVQQQAHTRIATVVSTCLSIVFDQPYEFKILFERKRGRTEALLRFSRGGLDVDPLTASGGGVVDVAAFALRAACLMLHRPRLRRLLVLDEPFRFVSADYQPNVRAMMEQMAKEMDLQIVQVTHNEQLITGKVVEL